MGATKNTTRATHPTESDLVLSITYPSSKKPMFTDAEVPTTF